LDEAYSCLKPDDYALSSLVSSKTGDCFDEVEGDD